MAQNRPGSKKPANKKKPAQEQRRAYTSADYEPLCPELPNHRTWMGDYVRRSFKDDGTGVFLRNLFKDQNLDGLYESPGTIVAGGDTVRDQLRKTIYRSTFAAKERLATLSAAMGGGSGGPQTYGTVSAEDLIQGFAPEYQDRQDEFKRRDLVEQLKPMYEKWLKDVAQRTNIAWVQHVGVNSSNYDPVRKGYLLEKVTLHRPLDLPLDIRVGRESLRFLPFVEVDEARARELAEWADPDVHKQEWARKGINCRYIFEFYVEGTIMPLPDKEGRFFIQLTKMDAYLLQLEAIVAGRVKVNEGTTFRLVRADRVKTVDYPLE